MLRANGLWLLGIHGLRRVGRIEDYYAHVVFYSNVVSRRSCIDIMTNEGDVINGGLSSLLSSDRLGATLGGTQAIPRWDDHHHLDELYKVAT